MIKYLRGSDVETDVTRYKARLLGIAKENYVLWTESLGTDYINELYGTEKDNSLIQKKVDSGEVDDLGQTVWTYSNEYALVIDTEKPVYNFYIALHQGLMVDATVLEADGWDITQVKPLIPHGYHRTR